jgi:hypothetical protein
VERTDALMKKGLRLREFDATLEVFVAERTDALMKKGLRLFVCKRFEKFPH